MVETDSSSSNSDDHNYDTLRLMENKHPMVRLVIYGKIKRMLMSYLKEDVEDVDKKLLRGVYVRKIKDFDEDFIESH